MLSGSQSASLVGSFVFAARANGLDELVAYRFVMRSVAHQEAGNVEQNRPAAAPPKKYRNATSRSNGRLETMPTGSGSII
jgi:hypothetical protein